MMGFMIWGLIQRWNTARKLAKGRCAECAAILPDSGAPFAYNTCSEECAHFHQASIIG